MLCVKAPAETGNRYVLISADSDKNSISNIFRKKKCESQFLKFEQKRLWQLKRSELSDWTKVNIFDFV